MRRGAGAAATDSRPSAIGRAAGAGPAPCPAGSDILSKRQTMPRESGVFATGPDGRREYAALARPPKDKMSAFARSCFHPDAPHAGSSAPARNTVGIRAVSATKRHPDSDAPRARNRGENGLFLPYSRRSTDIRPRFCPLRGTNLRRTGFRSTANEKFFSS